MNSLKLIFLALILFVHHRAVCQLLITDSNNKPIPFVQVISNNPNFFAQTNLQGQLSAEEIKHLKASDTLFFYHVAYERAHRVKNTLFINDTVKLSEKNYRLNEVVISAKRKKNEYQVIKACYRSYQANNDSMAFYTDGQIELLSKLNSDRYELMKKDYRAYTDTKPGEEVSHRKVSIQFKPTIPYPPLEYLPYQYARENNLKYIRTDSTHTSIYYQDTILLGTIERIPGLIKYNVNDIVTGTTRKSLNTEIHYWKFEVIMLFRDQGYSSAEDISVPDDLIYTKTLREYIVRHDKDQSATKILNTDELFFEEVSYIDKPDKKSYAFSRGMPKSSNYSFEFWKSCDCDLYYPPQQELLRGMYEW